MRFRDYASLVLMGVAVTCALVVTVLAVRAQSRSNPNEQVVTILSDQEWRAALEGGERIGHESAPVTMVIFGDFECPACGRFARNTLSQARALLKDSLTVVYHHFPLPYHRFAKPAMRASECASEQAQFAAMHDALFTYQDSLGIVPFTVIAWRAGITDTASFRSCVERPSDDRKASGDLALATRLGVDGTPTVIVNGSRFKNPPSVADLSAVARTSATRVMKVRASVGQ
ncbi:MAG: thioredoxin domain-containing protein [Gemmatimonadales bacterium]|nr:thioredoxin domain-containing protein [Gemmatimonadales bacterium]